MSGGRQCQALDMPTVRTCNTAEGRLALFQDLREHGTKNRVAWRNRSCVTDTFRSTVMGHVLHKGMDG